MPIVREPPANVGEQLTFKGLELAALVGEIEDVEAARKSYNDDFKDRLKALKKRLLALSAEIRQEAKER